MSDHRPAGVSFRWGGSGAREGVLIVKQEKVSREGRGGRGGGGGGGAHLADGVPWNPSSSFVSS